VVAKVEEETPWKPALGVLLLVVAGGLVAWRLARRPKIEGQRLVTLGADGKPTTSELVLKKSRVGRAKSRIEVGTGSLELEASEGGGAVARPKGLDARIEGVPIRGSAELVHGMVVEVESEGTSQSFVYADRELNPSEKKRAWTESDQGYVATDKVGSISDVASVDEFYVVDESEEALPAGARAFGDRQLFSLDDEGKIAGEARRLKAHRIDGETAGVELSGRTVSFHVDEGAGAVLLPLSPRGKLTVEGVPVGAKGVALVHGMVFELEGKSWLYLERNPTEPELRRKHKKRDTDSKEESISDVGSSDDLLVVDDTEDGTAPSSDDTT
jgi:hypothetical protein